jgi:YYY domain-containing protein
MCPTAKFSWNQRSEFFRRCLWWLVVVVITLAGCTARMWNLDFDNRQHQNPDERHWALTAAAIDRAPPIAQNQGLARSVVDWLDGQKSPANPYRGTDFFVYGPSLLALTRAAAGVLAEGVVRRDQPVASLVEAFDWIGIPLLDSTGNPRFDDAYNSDLIGRLLGALFDSGTIVVVALLGRRVGGRRVGILASVFQASSVLSIQYAHFLGAEPLAQLMCAVVLLASIHLVLDRRKRFGLLAGGAAGLTMAIKISTFGVIAVPIVILVAQLVANRQFLRRRGDFETLSRRRVWRSCTREIARLALFLIAFGFAFRVAYPSAFVGLGLRPNPQVIANFRLLRSLSNADLPPAVQWAARLPILDPLRTLILFAVGPGTSLAALFGAVLLWRSKHLARSLWFFLVLGGATLAAFLTSALQFSPTSRYFVPMLPSLHVLAGFSAMTAFSKPPSGGARVPGAKSWRPHFVGLGGRFGLTVRLGKGQILVFLCVVASVLWSVAFVQGVYGGTHTRIRASRWIAENVPPGSVLSSEAWDDGLPLSTEGIDPSRWKSERFDLFGVDTPTKVGQLAKQIQRTNYIVESSPRVWKTVRRIPARYPSTIRFFDALDNNKLGFVRVATFSSPPRMGSISISDSAAEEAFSVYDHPEVRIWKRATSLSLTTVERVLGIDQSAIALQVPPIEAKANGLLLRPAELRENLTGGTFNQAFASRSNGLLHAVAWLILLELLALAVFVSLAPTLKALPDAGFGLCKLGGLFFVSIPLWMIVAWGFATLSWVLAVLLVGLVLLLGCFRFFHNKPLLAQLWRERRRMLVIVELITVCTFVGMIALRFSNPDLWHPYRGGEKPFEMAYLTGVLRTKTLPPYDPWFSGGVQNYYYGGWFLVSSIARIVRTSPSVAFNLALAAFASLTAATAFSASSALAKTSWIDRNQMSGETVSESGRSVRVAGFLGAGLVLLGSNAAPALEVLRAVGKGSLKRDWWSYSRVIPKSTAITEFPAWSFLFGDLHPHLMGLPILCALIVTSCAFVLYQGEGFVAGNPLELSPKRFRGIPRELVWGLAFGLILGLIRATNTWDFPMSCAISVFAIAWSFWRGYVRPPNGGEWSITPVRRREQCKGMAVVLLGLCFALFVCWAPYTWRGQVFDAGVARNSDPTPIWSWVVHFGWFGAVTLLTAGFELWPRGTAFVRGRAVTFLIGAVLTAAGLLLLLPSDGVLMVDGVLALLCLGVVLRRKSTTHSPAALIMLGSAWGLGALVEIVTILNDNGRQNTVFKFWYQMWLLLGIGSAAALAEVFASANHLSRMEIFEVAKRFFAGLRGSRSEAGAEGLVRSGPQFSQTLAVGLVGLGLAFSGSFFGLAVNPRASDRVSRSIKSLDGSAFLSVDFEVSDNGTQLRPNQELGAVEWLRENVRGLPVIAEAPGIGYSWRSRMSWLTGLPTVLGWPYHESQQRRPFGASISMRQTDLKILYTSTSDDEVLTVLRRYSIQYVVLGGVERSFAKPASFGSVLTLSCVKAVFEDTPTRLESVSILRVDPKCLV